MVHDGAMAPDVTPWIEALRPRGGPLVDAAARFVASLGPPAFPRGAEGLRHLASLVGGDLPGDEDRFVEGAGALLGLLLLEHLGDGEHCHDGARHGIALGAHGWFDPFAAITAALDAGSPRAELARWVRDAEDEHAGTGAVARVVRAFREALAAERPDLVVTAVRALAVSLDGGVEVDLAQVARATEGEPVSAVHAAVRKILSLLPGAREGAVETFAEIAERLLPRLVGPRFHAELEARAASGGARLYGRPIGHGVRVALVVAHPGRSRFVREAEIERWGLAPEEAERIAIARLAACSGKARFARVDTDAGPLVVARTGDGLDAARLVLPGLHDVLRDALDAGPIHAAVPHRDVLLASGPGRALDVLRARARDDHARAPHAITDALFEVTPGGLVAR